MNEKNDLKNSLIDFAVRIIRLSERLPGTIAGKHILGQILRSETSRTSNYGEATGEKSRTDFIHKFVLSRI